MPARFKPIDTLPDSGDYFDVWIVDALGGAWSNCGVSRVGIQRQFNDTGTAVGWAPSTVKRPAGEASRKRNRAPAAKRGPTGRTARRITH